MPVPKCKFWKHGCSRPGCKFKHEGPGKFLVVKGCWWSIYHKCKFGVHCKHGHNQTAPEIQKLKTELADKKNEHEQELMALKTKHDEEMTNIKKELTALKEDLKHMRQQLKQRQEKTQKNNRSEQTENIENTNRTRPKPDRCCNEQCDNMLKTHVPRNHLVYCSPDCLHNQLDIWRNTCSHKNGCHPG